MTPSDDDRTRELRRISDALTGEAGQIATSIVDELKSTGQPPIVSPDATATLAIGFVGLSDLLHRYFLSGSVKPTHHRCRRCVLAAGNTETAWINAEQYTDEQMAEHEAGCPHDLALIAVAELRDRLAARQPEVLALRREIDRLRAICGERADSQEGS